MNKYKKLSFIVPCFNSEATIKETLDSIYNQNIKIPFEVVCTNDASTDNTLAILFDYKNKYNNITVMAHEFNQGGGLASNTAVFASGGDLLFRLDSDNILVENSINGLIDLIEDSEYDAASFAEIKFFESDKNHVINSWSYENTNGVSDISHALKSTRVPASSGNYLYTKDSFIRAKGYPTNKGAIDAWGFGIRQLMTDTAVSILPNSYYLHRYNPKGYWQREEDKKLNSINALNLMKEFNERYIEETQQWMLSAEAEKTFFKGLESGRIRLK